MKRLGLALASLVCLSSADSIAADPVGGSATARSFVYSDDHGLTVTTVGAEVSQHVSSGVALSARGLVNHIQATTEGTVIRDDASQLTGHRDVDAVTSASVSVTGGNTLDKTRYEGVAGATIDTIVGAAPLRIEPFARLSSELDYFSYSGRLRATIDLAERNTTLAGFGGYGRDTSDPIEPPPGEKNRWPGTQERWTAGLSLNQILSPNVLVSASAGLSVLFGTLENPYRRAIVRTSLFPERLPAVRERWTGFVGASIYLGLQSALHVRNGAYRDSWGVLGWIPEVALAKQVGDRGLIAVRYRHYRQTAAAFYATSYDRIERYLSGDVRLGRLYEHSPGGRVEWTVVRSPGGAFSLTVDAGYDLSLLTYAEIERRVVAHIASIGVQATY